MKTVFPQTHTKKKNLPFFFGASKKKKVYNRERGWCAGVTQLSPTRRPRPCRGGASGPVRGGAAGQWAGRIGHVAGLAAQRNRRKRSCSGSGAGVPAEAALAVPKLLSFPFPLPGLLWVVYLVS